MKAKDIRERSDDELRKSLGDLEEQLFKLRFQKSTGQIENGSHASPRPSPSESRLVPGLANPGHRSQANPNPSASGSLHGMPLLGPPMQAWSLPPLQRNE